MWSLGWRVLVPVLVLGSIPGPGPAAQAKAVVHGALGKSLEKTVETEKPDFQGAVLVASRGTVVLARGFGLGKGAGKKDGSDALFDLGTSSSLLTAVAVLHLAGEESLTLDDPLSRWLPEVPPDKEPITLRHLLQHVSGFARGVEGYQAEDVRSREAVVRAILARPLAHEPGAQFEYADANYTLLAAVVEGVTGGAFEDYVTHAILEPCKLESTSFAGWSGRKLDRERATERPGKRCVCDASWTWGERGVLNAVTTVLDLNLLLQALRKGPLLEKGPRGELFRPGSDHFTCGMEVIDGPGGSKRFGHRGATNGYGAALALDPEDGTTVVVLARDQATAVHLRTVLLAMLAAKK